MTTDTTTTPVGRIGRALLAAMGTPTQATDDVAHEIVGAQNDYNSRGRGSTMSRRVLRNGEWQWVSRPASTGRMRAADRKDTQYGEVYEGEIVAEYTLGRGGGLEGFRIVLDHAGEGWFVDLDHVKTKGGYRLTWKSKSGRLYTLDVSDPAWR